MPYFDIMVPTIDTTRFGYLIEKLIALERPVLFTGQTGVGKVRAFLLNVPLFCQKNHGFSPVCAQL